MKAYFNAELSHRVSRRFCQNIALHLHARQLGPQPADLHLLGAHGLGCSSARDQRSGDRCDALAAIDQPHGLLLEFERVPGP